MADALAETPPKEARRRSKPSRGSPTGRTPRQDEKKLAFQAAPREPLSDTSRYVPMSAWATKETKALVEFMLFHNPEKWESTKDSKFWTSAATFVRDSLSHTNVQNLLIGLSIH